MDGAKFFLVSIDAKNSKKKQLAEITFPVKTVTEIEYASNYVQI